MIRPLPPPPSGVCPYCGRKIDNNKNSENRGEIIRQKKSREYDNAEAI
jgi:hypothetical protein